MLARKKGLIICFVLHVTLAYCRSATFFLLSRVVAIDLWKWEVQVQQVTTQLDSGGHSLIGLLCGWILAVIIGDIFYRRNSDSGPRYFP